jgi:hypothetical protein
MFAECGIDTGLDADAVTRAARAISERLAIPLESAVGRNGTRQENCKD